MKHKYWDLSNKKWLYWTGFIGFFLSLTLLMWLIAFIISLTEKKKPDTQNYKVYKNYQKFIIVVGNLIWVVLIVIFFLAYLGFMDSEEYSNTYSDEELLTLAKEKVVWVKYEFEGKDIDGLFESFIATGSGVIYSQSNNYLEIVTNRHVVDCGYNNECFQRNKEKITVRFSDGNILEVESVSFANNELDLAVLKVKNPNPYLYEGTYISEEVIEGEKVLAVGFPGFSDRVVEYKTSWGKVTGINELLMTNGHSFTAINTDAFASFGSSGGGLFDIYGNLLGIVTWGSDRTYAISVSTIEDSNIEFNYCEEGTYVAMDGLCYPYCNESQVVGDDGMCVDVCEDVYCGGIGPDAFDGRCEDDTMILGNDGYCHPPCGTEDQYCSLGSYCIKGGCVNCPAGTYLYKDGTCRY